MKKPSLLILSSRIPALKGKPDSMTVFKIIEYFSPKFEITLVTLSSHEDEYIDLDILKKMCVKIIVKKRNKYLGAVNMLFYSIFHLLPLQTSYYYSKKLNTEIKRLAESNSFDLIYTHNIRMSEYTKKINGLKKILGMQVSQTLNTMRMKENIKSIYYKTLYTVEYYFVKRYESKITKYFDVCLLISKHDHNAIHNNKEINNIFYNPHGIDVDYYTSSYKAKKDEKVIIYAGFMETPTNIDAVLFFYKNIFKKIKAAIPDIKFYIVGKNPPPTINRLSKIDPNVIVTGYVKDVRPYYEMASVAIAPMRIAAGLQNKLLVGMSMGVPVVSTSIANEGIGAMPNKQILIANDPEQFAEQVIKILQDDKFANEITTNARLFIDEQWTWEYHFDKLDSLIIKPILINEIGKNIKQYINN